MTKKIGAKSEIMGDSSCFSFLEKSLLVLKCTANGKIKLRDKATPATKAPIISGAPKLCERYEKSKISEIITVGIKPGILDFKLHFSIKGASRYAKIGEIIRKSRTVDPV